MSLFVARRTGKVTMTITIIIADDLVSKVTLLLQYSCTQRVEPSTDTSRMTSYSIERTATKLIDNGGRIKPRVEVNRI